jgi:hypothetical protein
MIGLSICKEFLVFNDKLYDKILNDIFFETEFKELTEENKSKFIDYFKDNFMNCLETIFEENDLSVEEDDIDNNELNTIFNEFENYINYILKNKL